jgi:ABC-type glycerol-3-phosphate transport system substrate-binding protein
VKTLALAALLAAVLLAGCGGSKTTSTQATTTAAAPPNPANAMRALIVKDPSLAGRVETL